MNEGRLLTYVVLLACLGLACLLAWDVHTLVLHVGQALQRALEEGGS